jgi:hypothetical protein
MFSLQKESLREKSIYLAKIIFWTIFYSIIKEWIIDLVNIPGIDDWGIGLIGVAIFAVLYIVDNINIFIFRIDRINKFILLFFLAWFIADMSDFIIVVLQVGGFI